MDVEVTGFNISISHLVPLPLELTLQRDPLFWRFIPGVTRFVGKGELSKYPSLTFEGYMIDSKLVLRTDNKERILLKGYNANLIELNPYTYPSRVEFAALPPADQQYHLKPSVGRAIPVDDNHPEVKKVYDKLYGQLESLTIRDKKLLHVLRDLHIQSGLQYALAITGGALRDAILGVEPKDIDLVICAPHEVLATVLKDKFGSKGEALTDNTLRCTGKSRTFGQLKVMRKEVFYSHLEWE